MSTRNFMSGDAYGVGTTISNAAGAAANADATPTATLYRNGAADTAVVVTVTNPETGVYGCSCTIPVAYAVGDRVSILLAATVGGVASKQFVDHIRLVGYPNNALPSVAAGTTGGVPILGTGAGGINPANGKIGATIAAGDNADKAGYSLAAAYDSSLAAIKSKTDLLPTWPANLSTLAITTAGLVGINLAQAGLTPRDLGAVADNALTVGDALVAAIAGTAGKEQIAGTGYVVKTPLTGTVIRTFVLDSATIPTTRS